MQLHEHESVALGVLGRLHQFFDLLLCLRWRLAQVARVREREGDDDRGVIAEASRVQVLLQRLAMGAGVVLGIRDQTLRGLLSEEPRHLAARVVGGRVGVRDVVERDR